MRFPWVLVSRGWHERITKDLTELVNDSAKLGSALSKLEIEAARVKRVFAVTERDRNRLKHRISIFKRVHDWQVETFPEVTLEGQIEHLKREVLELAANPSDPHEIADCMILLTGIAKRQGINPLDAMEEKMNINRSRTWGALRADGTVEHER